MTPDPIRQILEEFPTVSEAEAVAPWLLNLDANEDGALEKAELQNHKERLHCDIWVNGLGSARWKKLEAILVGRSLVKKSPKPCELDEDKTTPRLPTASAGLFRALPYDYVFQLGKGMDLQAVLDLLQGASYPAQQRKNFYEVTLSQGRILRIETSRGTLQKIHYLDDQGKPSMLCRLEFWEILRQAGRFDDFFAKNPFYEQEREVWGRYYSVVYTYAKTPVLTVKEAGEKNWRGVLLFPDIHGKWERYRALEKLVRKEKLDWLALEMLSQNLQPAVDDFLTAKENSTSWSEAKRKIQNHLQPFWAGYFKKLSDPDGNPYYQLLLLCRKRGIKVVALDAPITYTTTADPKHSPLSIGTRNRLWAENIPAKGRGIVYGGQFHFTGYAKVRVQDFLWEKNAKRKIQLVQFGK